MSRRQRPPKKGFKTKAYFRGGGSLRFPSGCRRRIRPAISFPRAYRVWFTAWCDIRAAPGRFLLRLLNAYWLLYTDACARRYWFGSDLLALSIGHIRALNALLFGLFEPFRLRRRRNDAALTPGSSHCAPI